MKKKVLWTACMAACMICLSGCANSLPDVSDTVDEALAYVREKAEDFTAKDKEKETDLSDDETISDEPVSEEPAASEEPVSEETAVEETVSEEPDEKKILLPISAPVDMVFSSGAGAWGTEMTLHPDGTFEGRYEDCDSGDIGENYNGVTYIATFTGKFDDIEQVNDYTYRMILTEVNIEETEEWIENGVKYIPSDVYGISGGDVFYFLTDKTPMNALTEDCMSWTRAFFIEEHQETLMRYGLYNALQGYAFFEQKLDEY